MQHVNARCWIRVNCSFAIYVNCAVYRREMAVQLKNKLKAENDETEIKITSLTFIVNMKARSLLQG
jgi:hypothetical protein